MALAKNGSTYSEGLSGVWATNWTSGSFAVGSGSNRILVVSIGVYLAAGLTNPCVTGVKWGGSGGTPLTKVASAQFDTGATREREASLWYLVAPTVQTSTLYLTFADSIRDVRVSATVWDGAAQTTPFTGANTAEHPWATTHSVVVSSATNSLVIDSINGTLTALTCSQTQDALGSTGEVQLGQSNKAGAASVTMTWTSANMNSVQVAASLAPYVDASHINIALAVGGS
jgi:hypothetical protein